jgi:hypothetical protein
MCRGILAPHLAPPAPAGALINAMTPLGRPTILAELFGAKKIAQAHTSEDIVSFL